MKVLEFDRIQEKIYIHEHSSGLKVFVIPKKGYNKIFSTFATYYGSINNTFIAPDDENETRVPDGIAHFLEHKLFEQEDGSVMDKFSQLGADSNAYTSFTQTVYLFSCTDLFDDNFRLLIDYVQNPYLTDENVEKEKGIIGQEIKMYNDNADWRVFFNLLNALYVNHPVKIDIAGTIESIDEITAEHLYTCYHTFYHPSNMLLFIVGNVEPEKMMAFIEENQNKKTFDEAPEIKRFFEEEPEGVAVKERELRMDVQKPKVYVGLKAKETDLSGDVMLKHELAIQIGLECIFGRASDFYTDVYEGGLIDETFAYDFSLEKGYGFALIGSDTNQPDELANKIKQTVNEAQNIFNEQAIERIKRKKIGFFLRALNSLEYIANQFTRYKFNDMNLFDCVPVIEKITLEDVKEAFQSIQGESQQTVFKILPLSEGKQ